MAETPIKAVELVRSIRDALYEEIKSLSPEELMAFIEHEAALSTFAQSAPGSPAA
jgi:hypothetical protein